MTRGSAFIAENGGGPPGAKTAEQGVPFFSLNSHTA